MPRGREELREHLKRCLERVDRVPLDEPWTPIRFPKVDAAKRAVNKEKRTRVVFSCLPEQYAAFHEELKRFRDVIGNVTVAHDILIRVLSEVSDQEIAEMAADD